MVGSFPLLTGNASAKDRADEDCVHVVHLLEAVPTGKREDRSDDEVVSLGLAEKLLVTVTEVVVAPVTVDEGRSAVLEAGIASTDVVVFPLSPRTLHALLPTACRGLITRR